MYKFLVDESFWIEWEKRLQENLEKIWLKVKATSKTDLLDFDIVDSKGNKVWLELKSRRCKKDAYPDTMIWINKLIEAYKRYNDNWQKSLFVFKYEDWIFYLDPFEVIPRFDYRMWRWDRGDFDKPKGWCYYPVNELSAL